GDAVRAAVLDYAQAITDMARNNIFPGDMLPKNFGVSRHGRAVFYDYDELCLVSDCVFRAWPQPRTPEEAMADEPWFH
ncbi:isocitrate dehydrogenase kinase/phosphatase-domain containing protein, partial [Mycobacterium tuberculosis]